MDAAIISYTRFVKTLCKPPPLLRQKALQMRPARTMPVPGRPPPAPILDQIPDYAEIPETPAAAPGATVLNPGRAYTKQALALMSKSGINPEMVDRAFPSAVKITLPHIRAMAGSAPTRSSSRRVTMKKISTRH